VRALHGLLGRKAGNFGHVANKTDAGHFCNESVVLGHVADERAKCFAAGMRVEPKHTSATFGRHMEAKQGVYESGLAGAVGPEKPDGTALQNAGEPVKNRSATELNFEPIELNRWNGHLEVNTD
jgi:hypothetical protein